MKRIVNSKYAPAPVGPYNHSVAAAGMLYVSGQIALDPLTGDLKTSTIQEETHQVMKNIQAILESAEISFQDIVKCSVFVSDMNQYAAINEVYATYFNEETAPARELVEVANLPKFVNVEISVIAVLNK